MQTIGQPKRTRKENAFLARQSINLFFLRAIAQHKTILHKLAFNRLNCALHPFVSNWKKPGERHHQEARVQCIRPEVLRKCFLRSEERRVGKESRARWS